MQAILKFNLDDLEDAKRHLHALKATDYHLAIWEFAEYLIRCNKHTDAPNINTIRETFRNILTEYKVDLE